VCPQDSNRALQMALDRDISELLASWSPHIASSALIFTHAPSSNIKALMAGDERVGGLTPGDSRVRRIPFVVQRPTFSEAKRVVKQLATVFEVPPPQEAPAGQLQVLSLSTQPEVPPPREAPAGQLGCGKWCRGVCCELCRIVV
jgi:Bacteroidetes VLRF1 release factor